MKWNTPCGELKLSPQQCTEIKELVKGRTCRACPTTHVNTGNIITYQANLPLGRRKHWPGWTCQFITGISVLNADGERKQDLIVSLYGEAHVYQPPTDLAYNHVHVHVSSRTLNVEPIWRDVFLSMQRKLQLHQDSFHFWCAKHASSKTMFIFNHEVIPHKPLLYHDVDLMVGPTRSDNQFLLAEHQLPASRYPLVQTPSGNIAVLEAGGQNYEDVAQLLSRQHEFNRHSTREA